VNAEGELECDYVSCTCVILVTMSPMEAELSHVGKVAAGRGERCLAEVSSVSIALLCTMGPRQIGLTNSAFIAYLDVRTASSNAVFGD
jgi:hypothetical protein